MKFDFEFLTFLMGIDKILKFQKNKGRLMDSDLKTRLDTIESRLLHMWRYL